MKPIAWFGMFLFLLSATHPLCADEASKIAKVEEFFRLSRFQQTMGQLMQMVRQQTDARMIEQISGSQVPPGPREDLNRYQDEIYDLLDEAMGWEAMKAEYIRAYVDAFTEEELDGIVAFYRSPAGQSLVEKTPQLMARASQVTQQRMATIAPKLQELARRWRAHVEEKMRQNSGEANAPPAP